MAEAVVPEPSNEPVSKIEDLPRLEQPQKAVHGGRFMVGYAVVVLMVAAVLGALALMTREDTSPAAVERWASWAPEETGFQTAREIAREISTNYKGASGEQLAAVTASPGEVQGLPLRYVAIRGSSRQQLTQGDISVLEPGETILYTFCGLGGQRNCALPGQPSPERSLLLRREALELSLYTFKHMDGVQSVISLLPPPTAETNLAVFLQRRHVEDALGKPLAATFASEGPHFADDVSDREARAINKYTELQFFRSAFELAPDQSVILNLEPPGTE